MTNVEMVNRASDIVATLGLMRNTKDASGFNDWLHPFGVAERVKHYGEIIQTVALLHDVVEDMGITLKDLEDKDFPEVVVNAVDHLTRRAEEPYEEYIERLSHNKMAIVVKIADLQYNLNRVDYGVPEEKAKKWRTRWVQAMRFLRDKLAIENL